MSKSVQILVLAFVSLASFLIGVKYSEQVKSHVSWMSESKDEVALPDLTNEEIDNSAVTESQETAVSKEAGETNTEALTQQPESKK